MLPTGKIPQKSIYNVGFVRPTTFYPQNHEQNGKSWETVPNVIIHEHDKKNKSQSRIGILYPNFPGRPEFSHEEYMAYRWARQNKENAHSQKFVQKYDQFWKNSVPETEEREVQQTSTNSMLGTSMKNLELMQKKAKSKSTGMLNPVSEKVAFQSASPNPSPKPSPFAQRNKTMKPIASIQPIMQTRSPIPSTINRSSPLRINPFALSFKQRMVEKTDIKERLRNLPSCTFKHNGRSLSKGQSLDFGGEQFYVIKALAKGGYGTIYTAKAKSTGEIYALKQEKPPNLWEFYVCLELKERIHNQQILPAFTKITHGLLTNDHSILATNYAPYGSLIEVFNKVRVETHRCCEELVVISIAHQILTIFQYLHEAKIIHADVKPENFLVIRDVGPHPYIQLIDFGVSIDMKLVQNEFPNFDGFRAASKKDLIIEMHENRPWSYQIDYFGIAGTIHVMLFGEHMKIRKDNIWKPKTAIKRYMNQRLWEKFFCELLNIVGEKPNVEEIIKILDGELKTPENHARDKFIEFNRILKSK